MYVIPGRSDTLRINGRARLVTDASFFDVMIVLMPGLFDFTIFSASMTRCWAASLWNSVSSMSMSMALSR